MVERYRYRHGRPGVRFPGRSNHKVATGSPPWCLCLAQAWSRGEKLKLFVFQFCTALLTSLMITAESMMSKRPVLLRHRTLIAHILLTSLLFQLPRWFMRPWHDRTSRRTRYLAQELARTSRQCLKQWRHIYRYLESRCNITHRKRWRHNYRYLESRCNITHRKRWRFWSKRNVDWRHRVEDGLGRAGKNKSCATQSNGNGIKSHLCPSRKGALR